MIASLRLGGAERQLASLACMLKGNGNEVEVLSYREGDYYLDTLAGSGVPHTFIPGDKGDLRLIRDIAAHLRESRCEVLISFLAGTNIKACLAGRQCPGLRVIVSERNCNTSYLPHDALRFALYRKYADAVVCNSYAQTEFIRKHCPALQGRLRTIPNFTDLERFRPAAPGRSDGPLRIVTTARLDSRKNALGLIRAASRCEGVRFDWYGAAAEDRYGAKCRRLIEKLGLEGRFFIHPAEKEVERIYREADAFCLPSFYEGTPNAMTEALASGLPVLCSSVSDNPRYICGNGFLFDPRKDDSLVSAIRSLKALNSSEAAEYGSRSRRIAEKHFSKDLFLERYTMLLGGIPGGTDSPA